MSQVLPHNLEAEKSVVGACILEREPILIVAPILKPEFLYDGKLKTVYEAILKVHNSGGVPDLITVIQELTNIGKLDFVGGAYEISKLSTGSVMSLNVEEHCRIIQQCYLLREVFRISGGLYGRTTETGTDPLDLIESAINQFTALVSDVENKKALTLGTYIDRAIEQAKQAISGKRKSVPVKIKTLNQLCGGYKSQRLIVMAARPGMGKTAVAFGDAIYAAEQGYPVAIFSQEMSGNELGERALSQGSGMDAMKISNNQLDADELRYLEGIKQYHNIPLYIDDTAGLTFSRLRSKAIRMKREHNIQMFIIDYLQLCEGEGNSKNREQEISKISRGLKKLAKELDVPVLALSQLNRKNEDRAGNKPKLSDLRDSGAIEQDADMVILLHRPEYYGENEYLLDNQPMTASELMVQIIAKNRGGVVGEIPCRWQGSTMEIKDWMY